MAVQHPMHAMIAPIGPPTMSAVVGTPRLGKMAATEDPGPEPQPVQMQPDDSQPDMPSNLPGVRRMTPSEQYESDLGNRLMADYEKDANPYGSANNHPGKLGKFLHGLSVATGGPNRRFMQEQQFGNALEGIDKEKALENEEQAQSDNLRSEIQHRDDPTFTPVATSEGYAGFNPKTNELEPSQGGTGITPYQKPGPRQHVVLKGPDGKPMAATFDPQTGTYYGNDEQPIANPQPFEKPPADTPHAGTSNGKNAYGFFTQGKGWTDANGNPLPNFQPMPNYAMVAPELKTFQTKDDKGQNVTKTLSGKTLGVLPDTTTQRNMAEMAATVQPMMESVIGEVQGLANSIGPAAGRWNQLMVNKGGADFPEFSGLDTDLDLLASAIVRTHFGARGGQEYRQELRKMFGQAQSPEDLVNRIQHAESWIEGYAASGGAKTPVGHAYQGGAGQQSIVQMNKTTGAYRYSTDGGKTWQAGRPPSR